METVTNYPKKVFTHAIVAVDLVIFSLVENKLQVLLLKLKETPHTGKWALPGGLVKIDENLDQAATRHMLEKANVKNVYLEQLYTFGEVNRDPLGRVISVAYFALVPVDHLDPQTIDRYETIELHPIDSLPELAYDHKEIIVSAVKRLQSKLSYTNIVYSLLPPQFTLTQLQKTYEIILGKLLDKRNFRKKIVSLDLLVPLNQVTSGAAHRPAKLYKFKSLTPQIAEIL